MRVLLLMWVINMGGKGSGTPKAALLKLDGTAIEKDGSQSRSDFFEFLQLPEEHNAKLEKIMTPDQAIRFRNHIVRMRVGTSAAIPMLCGGARCPVKHCPFHKEKNWPLADQCHPPGTMIKLSDGNSIAIEQLDPEKHKVVSFHRKKNRVMSNWKNGYPVTVSSKKFKGKLISIMANSATHKITSDHISVARFNEVAFNKFCVYLMRKGDNWRIGKSSIGKRHKSSRYGHDHYLGFVVRANKEQADALWILGVYDTNTEALLAEEYFSIKWQTSKVSFADSLSKIKSKHNGLYRWATKEQIALHHDSLINSEDFYRKKLEDIGRSIDYPIWQRGNHERTVSDVKLFTVYPMFIRACNLMPKIMDVPVYPLSNNKQTLSSTKLDWHPINVTYEDYAGKVYALDVQNKFKTYFANNIATHNCPIEINLIVNWMQSYIEDLNVDPESRTEMVLVNKLVECDIIDYRANIGFSVDEDAWRLLKVDISDNGKQTTEMTNAHPLIDIKEKTHRVRQQILESFAATRREKYKRAAALKKREDESIGDHFAKLKEAIGAMKSAEHHSLEQIKADAEKFADEKIEEADWEASEF